MRPGSLRSVPVAAPSVQGKPCKARNGRWTGRPHRESPRASVSASPVTIYHNACLKTQSDRLLVKDLFNKPASLILKPKEKPNWLFYNMDMVPPLRGGQRYYIFFNLRQKVSDRDSTDPYWLSMFIESAYARNQPVGTAEKRPFGRLAEEIVNSNRAA
jgi:hypothetical protein